MTALKETCRCNNVENVQNVVIVEVETMKRFFAKIQNASCNRSVQDLELHHPYNQIKRDASFRNTDAIDCRLNELSINVDSMLTRMSAIINSENSRSVQFSHKGREAANSTADYTRVGESSFKNSFDNSAIIQDLTHCHVQHRIDKIHDSLWQFVSSIEPKGSSFLTSTKIDQLSNTDLSYIDNQKDASPAPFKTDYPKLIDQTCNVVKEEIDANEDDGNILGGNSSLNCIISEYQSSEFNKKSQDFQIPENDDLIVVDLNPPPKSMHFTEPALTCTQSQGPFLKWKGRFATEALVDKDFVPFSDPSLFENYKTYNQIQRTKSNAQAHAKKMEEELSKHLATTKLKNIVPQSESTKLFPNDSVSLHSEDLMSMIDEELEKLSLSF